MKAATQANSEKVNAKVFLHKAEIKFYPSGYSHPSTNIASCHDNPQCAGRELFVG